MRIEGLSSQGRADRSAGVAEASAAFKLARLAGLLAAAMAFGIALVAAILFGAEGGAARCFLFAGFLAVQAAAYTVIDRLEARGLTASGLISLILPGLAFVGGLSAAAISLILVSACLDIAAARFATRPPGGRNRLRPALASAALAPVLSAGLMFGADTFGLAAVIVAGLPAMASVFLLPADTKPAEVEADIRPLEAMLAAALSRIDAVQWLTDVTGTLERPPGAHHLASARQAMPVLPATLTEIVLIADRPPLLHALSRAVHEGQASEDLELRLDLDRAQRPPLAPPRFEPHKVSVAPAPSLPGRAIVTIVPAAHEKPVAPAVPDRPIEPADAALLARAFHDSVAPFNAGLGYLELLSDPLVSPRDLATFRAHAGEAREAMLQAYRNQLLLVRWLKLAEASIAPQPVLCPPADLVRDCLRLLHLDLPMREDAGAALADLAPEAARFAALVLLRAACLAGRKPASLLIEPHQRDLWVTIHWQPGPAVAADDMLQMALEAAALRHAGLTFKPLADGRRLIFAEALPSARGSAERVGAGVQQTEAARRAS